MSIDDSTLAEFVREALDYDHATGVFTWKTAASGRVKPGRVAGCLSSTTGYIMIRFRGELYRAHRLAWLYMNGSWPSKDLDHIDGSRVNNSIANLREAEQVENQQNRRGARRDSCSGFLGVSPDKKRWKAEIQVNKKRQHLGNFDSAEEAHKAYLDAKRRLHPFGNI